MQNANFSSEFECVRGLRELVIRVLQLRVASSDRRQHRGALCHGSRDASLTTSDHPSTLAAPICLRFITDDHQAATTKPIHCATLTPIVRSSLLPQLQKRKPNQRRRTRPELFRVSNTWASTVRACSFRQGHTWVVWRPPQRHYDDLIHPSQPRQANTPPE